tara:strand:+ start:73 stop:228 length:156 start_codon:yes stop_codon:yes gene_type:complete
LGFKKIGMIKFFIALLVAATTLLIAFISFAVLSELKSSPEEIKKVIELEEK